MPAESGAARPAPGALPAGQPTAGLVREVTRVLSRLGDGGTVVVALSGGPDSVGLTELTRRARPDLDLRLVYVSHGLRDDRDDRGVVRAHADRLGVPLTVREVQVRPDGHGPEAAARTARYRALRAAAEEAGARRILLGHTAEDQAETVLLRLARGTGLPGLGAMVPVDGDLVRPLLRLRRGDVRALVDAEGLVTVADPDNRDRRLRRVRARTGLLPALERLGSDAVGAVTRLAALARRDEEVLDRQAAAWTRRLVRRVGPVAALRTDGLDGLPPALAGRVVRTAHDRLLPGADPLEASHVEAVLTLTPGGAVDLPGLRATRAGGWLALAPRDPAPPRPRTLPVPGTVAWPVPDVTVVAGTAADAPRPPAPPPALPPGWDPRRLTAALAPRTGTLTVRTRRPGDRVATPAGTRKLADVMIDAGLPRPLRALVPVVCADDEPVWVPGLAGGCRRTGGPAPLRLAVGSRPDERKR